MIEPVQRSADFVSENKGQLMEAAGQAVLSAIRQHNATHARADAPAGTTGH